FAVIGLCFLAGTPALCESVPILSGTVSYNPVTSLYTYEYALDNRFGPGEIWEIGIRTGSTYFGAPVHYSAPPGWSLYRATAGSISQPPVNEDGAFYVFNA